MSLYLKLISVLLLGGYTLHPFINGLGCDYQSHVISAQSEIYTTCKFGVVNTVAKDLKTGKSMRYVGIYGKSGDTVFFNVIKLHTLTKGSDAVVSITSLFSENEFYVAKNITYNKKDWILLQYPYYDIYPSTRIGQLAFFD
ncbi:hypothetical protein [Aeromonas hydrophila]|uniref:hypothetical protein n=1 Tax=Aeromonas hydrophila TaxID=644 RepID=UPI00191F5016|nr:hypothetical protein [Aeromonas hydrophila]MBL0560964.1 hypothetical protein [Aeromonas hydrophila]